MAHILVLDDEFDAVVMLKRLFEGKGHQVYGFTEEEEAMAHARANNVDLAIIDIRLKNCTPDPSSIVDRLPHFGVGPESLRAGCK